MFCSAQIPTDGLVLRGWYTTITLAVYGYLTKAIVHEPPPPVSVPLQGDVGGNPTAEWVQHHSQVTGSLVNVCTFTTHALGRGGPWIEIKFFGG